MSKNRSLPQSFKYAFEGLGEMFKNEPNFRIHVTIAFAAVITSILLKINSLEWLILMFTITFVLVMEMFNTILENLVDIVSPEKQAKAKFAKDIAAACVLIFAFVSIVVGLTIFIPRIMILASQY